MVGLVSMFRRHLNWFVKYMRTFCPRGLPTGEVEFKETLPELVAMSGRCSPASPHCSLRSPCSLTCGDFTWKPKNGRESRRNLKEVGTVGMSKIGWKLNVMLQNVSENIKRWPCSTVFLFICSNFNVFQDISAGVEWLYQQCSHTDNIYLATWIHVWQCLTILFWLRNLPTCTRVTHAPSLQGDQTVGISQMFPLCMLTCWCLLAEQNWTCNLSPWWWDQ